MSEFSYIIFSGFTVSVSAVLFFIWLGWLHWIFHIFLSIHNATPVNEIHGTKQELIEFVNFRNDKVMMMTSRLWHMSLERVHSISGDVPFWDFKPRKWSIQNHVFYLSWDQMNVQEEWRGWEERSVWLNWNSNKAGDRPPNVCLYFPCWEEVLILTWYIGLYRAYWYEVEKAILGYDVSWGHVSC